MSVFENIYVSLILIQNFVGSSTLEILLYVWIFSLFMKKVQLTLAHKPSLSKVGLGQRISD